MNTITEPEFERRANAARAAKGKPPLAWAGPFAKRPLVQHPGYLEALRDVEEAYFAYFISTHKKPYETPVLRANRPEDFSRLFECGLGQEFLARLVSNW